MQRNLVPIEESGETGGLLPRENKRAWFDPTGGSQFRMVRYSSSPATAACVVLHEITYTYGTKATVDGQRSFKPPIRVGSTPTGSTNFN